MSIVRCGFPQSGFPQACRGVHIRCGCPQINENCGYFVEASFATRTEPGNGGIPRTPPLARKLPHSTHKHARLAYICTQGCCIYTGTAMYPRVRRGLHACRLLAVYLLLVREVGAQTTRPRIPGTHRSQGVHTALPERARKPCAVCRLLRGGLRFVAYLIHRPLPSKPLAILPYKQHKRYGRYNLRNPAHKHNNRCNRF